MRPAGAAWRARPSQAMTKLRKTAVCAIAAIAAAAGAVVYVALDPATCAVFPRCPFYVLTGLKCPGCGSQLALH